MVTVATLTTALDILTLEQMRLVQSGIHTLHYEGGIVRKLERIVRTGKAPRTVLTSWDLDEIHYVCQAMSAKWNLAADRAVSTVTAICFRRLAATYWDIAGTVAAL